MSNTPNGRGRSLPARIVPGLLAAWFLAATACAAATATLVPTNAVWRYLDNGSYPGTNWTQNDFSDAGWSAGPAQLGYGDGDESTVVGYGGNATNRFITTYFRHAFAVEDPAALEAVTLRLLRDDGAVVYLNGVEVHRSNLPAGTITPGTFASTSISGTGERAYLSATIPVSLLRAGTNLLAVEIHQGAPDSSDISFALALVSGPVEVSRGPYLQLNSTNRAVVRWRTTGITVGRVNFGTNLAALNDFAVEAAPTSEHVVTLTGLAPGTRYYYAIGTTSGVPAGALGQFLTTSPATGSGTPVRLWILGDAGTADAHERHVRDAYQFWSATNGAADLMLMLGDNAYDTGTDEEYQAAVFNLLSNALRSTFVWPTIGNHETAQQTVISSFPYLEIFSLPAGAESGGLASGTERYYSFDHGPVHFVCLDSMTTSRATNGPMAQWLEADLAATAQPWIIAFWHHPPYTKGSHNSDTESQLIEMRSRLLPLLEAGGADLVLCGHSHSYERSHLLRGHYGSSTTLAPAHLLDRGDGRPTGTGAYYKTTAEGTVYAVAGSSGKLSSGTLNHPAMFTSQLQLGSMIIDVNGDRLDGIFLGTNAVVRDRFSLLKWPTNQLPPAAPVNLAVSPVGTNGIRLNWTDPATNETGFQIERSTNGLNFLPWTAPAANVAHVTNSPLPASTMYLYRIRATNLGGASDWSAGVAASTPGPPVIAIPPAATNLPAGTELVLTCVAGGTPPLSWEWRFNGVAIAGATNATLAIQPALGIHAGLYSVHVSNSLGTTVSTAIPVAIAPVTVSLTLTGSTSVLPGAGEVYEARATVAPPGTLVPEGLVEWWIDHAPAASTPLTNGVSSVNLGWPAAGIHELVAVYPGDQNWLGATSAVLVLTVNTAPVAMPDTLHRCPGTGLSFADSTLLANDTDADGQGLTLVSVNSPGTAGGTLQWTNGTLIYTAPAGDPGTESFTYVIADTLGATRSASVSIHRDDAALAPGSPRVEELGGGLFRVTGRGRAGLPYLVQSTDRFKPADWQPFATNLANGSGLIVATNVVPPGIAQRYYRILCR